MVGLAGLPNIDRPLCARPGRPPDQVSGEVSDGYRYSEWSINASMWHSKRLITISLGVFLESAIFVPGALVQHSESCYQIRETAPEPGVVTPIAAPLRPSEEIVEMVVFTS